MKKIISILFVTILTSVFFLSARKVALAATGCTSLGGTCQSTPCDNQKNLFSVATNPGACGAKEFCCKFESGSGITNPVIGKLGNDAAAASSGATFTSYFVTIWRAIIAVGALIMLFTFVNGALDWITAGGDQAKVSKARQKMTEGVMGFIILAGSFAVIALIGQLFFGDNFNLLKITFPTP